MRAAGGWGPQVHNMQGRLALALGNWVVLGKAGPGGVAVVIEVESKGPPAGGGNTLVTPQAGFAAVDYPAVLARFLEECIPLPLGEQ